MSKKNYLLSLLTTMIVAMLCLGFMSCSSDDEGGGTSNSFDLVGTWKSVKHEDHLYIFNADGTVDGNWSDTYSNWKLSNGKLYMTRRNNGLIEEWLVEYKDNLLYLTLPDGDATEYMTLVKVKVEETDNRDNGDTGVTITDESRFFVGSWDIVGTGAVFTFFPNGKALQRNSNSLYTGQWSYDSQKDLLLTTIELWQFSITAKFNDAWTGSALNTGKTVKADRTNYLNEYNRVVSFSDGTTNPFIMAKGYSTGQTIYATTYSDHELSFSDIVINDIQINAIAEEKYRYTSFYRDDITIIKRPIIIEYPNTENPILKLDKECTYIVIDQEHKNDTTIMEKRTDIQNLKPGTYQGKWSF